MVKYPTDLDQILKKKNTAGKCARPRITWRGHCRCHQGSPQEEACTPPSSRPARKYHSTPKMGTAAIIIDLIEGKNLVEESVARDGDNGTPSIQVARRYQLPPWNIVSSFSGVKIFPHWHIFFFIFECQNSAT